MQGVEEEMDPDGRRFANLIRVEYRAQENSRKIKTQTKVTNL